MSKTLDSLIASLKEAEAITDPLQQEWTLIQIRKQHQLTVKEFQRVRSLIEKRGGEQ